MKTLKKFICSSAKVEIVMYDFFEDKTHKLYGVIETPRKKKSKWIKTEKKFDFSDNANKYFMELVYFWCK